MEGMKFSTIQSAQNYLLKAHLISIEIDITRGLHAFSIVGLPDKAVEESRDRVCAALKNSGFKSPKQTNAKIVVSLAPADIKKEGPAFDLPIALGYLLASQAIDFNPSESLFVGELALDGRVRPIRGTLSLARLASENNIRHVFVPEENAREASVLENIHVYGVKSLRDVILHLTHKKYINPTIYTKQKNNISEKHYLDLDDIVGQETAKRGLIIAASGGHNIAFYGPPGTGKTMLARSIASILPELTFTESLEVTEIHSVLGNLDTGLITKPPLRAPHHTSSYTAIVGGGSGTKPGEITLAHRGVLFLDEFPEFDKRVIESLRQPLEDKSITLSRSKVTVTFPAHFMLVIAFNPCPCGNKGILTKICTCTSATITRYERKISGPIIDRIDMWIEVSKIDHQHLLQHHTNVRKNSIQARQTVKKARETQYARSKTVRGLAVLNSAISTRDLSVIASLSPESKKILDDAASIHNLSGRGYHRVIKLARTIADIGDSKTVESPHILEALQYRQKNRF